ncbi:MAG: class I SAM-dependent methyltransferase [Bacteroidales bacterium]|nr:class I SAM-dependent methyltransferase [Bacteroidales bacterium]
MKDRIDKFLPFLDIVLSPIVFLSAVLLKKLRSLNLCRIPKCKDVLLNVGVMPIQNHYYEPQFDFRKTILDYKKDRVLPGIDFNEVEQLSLLEKFKYAKELEGIPSEKVNELEFYWNNTSFISGDAEYWYQLLRTVKPKKIIEIGSGFSTLMALKALEKNLDEDPGYVCDHICIEPYEMPWLEKTKVKVFRKKVEDIEISYFSQLKENDILFIDSSHIIRPQGDVLYEYLQILPTLNKGVIVHIHDIFTPREYLKEWLEGEVKFWNEQYLLEAFLTNNNSWKIVGALNFLAHSHYERLRKIAPMITQEREPGSFYIQKIV